mmetsp:Transcript_62197/g.148389  ORF Transcript_62197/g.148389 Transcript_62197/m.148389 type:complete len:140 (+) Transcript_62197:1192-1611(+)
MSSEIAQAAGFKKLYTRAAMLRTCPPCDRDAPRSSSNCGIATENDPLYTKQLAAYANATRTSTRICSDVIGSLGVGDPVLLPLLVLCDAALSSSLPALARGRLISGTFTILCIELHGYLNFYVPEDTWCPPTYLSRQGG